MDPIEEYNSYQGTVWGEVRHEVFQKYGEDAYKTAHYNWFEQDIDTNMYKMYNLVNSDPVQFLVATVTCPLKDIRPIDPITQKPMDIPPIMRMMKHAPTHLHLEWFDANIPFATRDVLEANGVTWKLP